MAIQLEQFDLCDLEPNINIKITGPSKCGKTQLEQNILHILRAKNCNVTKIHDTTNNYTFNNYRPENQSDSFSVAVINRIYHHESGLVFSNLDYKNLKKEIKDKYKFTTEDCMNPYTFIVTFDGQIKYICIAENNLTYSTIFNNNPFCRNNINKLITKIANNYSMFHKINGELHTKLQLRLKELDNL